MKFQRNWTAILFLILFFSLLLNSCGSDNTSFSSGFSSEVQSWLNKCPANLTAAVDWWNLEEREVWSFGWNDEIPDLNTSVESKKTNCYWWTILFHEKFPDTEPIFIKQNGPYNHEILRAGESGYWVIYSCNPGKELFVDIYQLEAETEEEFWQEISRYFALARVRLKKDR